MSSFPLPDVSWEPAAPFWSAAERGELAIPRCRACGRYVWYPKSRCPACRAEDVSWEPVSGRGTLFSWAVVRRALLKPFTDRIPFVTGLVALEEDPSVRLVTNVVDCDPEALQVDMSVQVVFRPLRFRDVEGEVVVPLFVPSEPGRTSRG